MVIQHTAIPLGRPLPKQEVPEEPVDSGVPEGTEPSQTEAAAPAGSEDVASSTQRVPKPPAPSPPKGGIAALRAALSE